MLGADLLNRGGGFVVVDVEPSAEVHLRLLPVAEVPVRYASGFIRLCGIRVHLERLVAVADGGEALAHLDEGVGALGVDERGRCLEDDLGEGVHGALVIPGRLQILRLLLQIHHRVELGFGEFGGDVGAHGSGRVGLGLHNLRIGIVLEVAVVVHRGGLGIRRGGRLGGAIRARLRERRDAQLLQKVLEVVGDIGAVADGAAGPAQRGVLFGGELGHLVDAG